MSPLTFLTCLLYFIRCICCLYRECFYTGRPSWARHKTVPPVGEWAEYNTRLQTRKAVVLAYEWRERWITLILKVKFVEVWETAFLQLSSDDIVAVYFLSYRFSVVCYIAGALIWSAEFLMLWTLPLVVWAFVSLVTHIFLLFNSFCVTCWESTLFELIW